jgi:hypothetical protein
LTGLDESISTQFFVLSDKVQFITSKPTEDIPTTFMPLMIAAPNIIRYIEILTG